MTRGEIRGTDTGIVHVKAAGAVAGEEAHIRLAEATTIGRADADVSFPTDPRVSRKHAIIERRGLDYMIRDAGSTNGTWVNGRRVREALLRSGDMIVVGASLLAFQTAAHR